MPASPITDKTDNVTLSILVDGSEIDGAYQIFSVDIIKEINRVSTAKILFFLEEGGADNETFEISESKDFIPGNEIEIKAGYHSDEDTVFKGIIVNQGIRAKPNAKTFLEVKCCDKAVKLTWGKKSAYYKDLQDSAIIGKIIGNVGLSKAVDSTAITHPQLIQYYSTDWDFIVTRAEANGLLVYYEDDKLQVKKPEVSASPDLVVTYGKDIKSFSGELEAREQLPKVTSHSWDFSKQTISEGKSAEPAVNAQGNITGKKLSEIIGLDDYELHSCGPIPKEDLKEWANASLLKSRLSRFRGTVSFIGNAKAKVNTLIELAGLGARFNGNALISKVHHTLMEGRWNTATSFGLNPEWFYSKHQISAPPAGGLLPAISGLQNGTVKKIDEDPDGEHRVQVDVPMIAPTGDGIWARLSNFYATSGKGNFFYPEVGDEVVLGFLNNDPRFPVILGSLYSKKITPAYTADKDNSIKAIVTKNDLKIELNDKDKITTIETPASNKMIFSDKDKSITIQDQNGNKIEMSSSGITIKSAKDITIQATGKIDLKAGTNITLSSSGGDIALSGLNVNAKANIAFSAQGAATAELKASGNTSIKGAMVMIN